MYKVYSNTSIDNDIDVYIHNPEFCIDLGIQNTVDKFYLHRQNIASDTWQVTHHLNKYPSVTVVDSGESAVVGEVTYIDNNNLVISFTSPFSGKAYLN